MNEFYLYEQLCVLEGIAKQYPAGQAYAAQTRAAADQLVSQVYRVAVIGEFKKGKSSLINALLGSEVLPTDILPMTASINRVVYGEKKSITIYYKSGETEERTVAELLDFGTKYDAQKAERAGTVREIVVHYPSVFCRNHIELIDTPGLNDNEAMTDVTWSILGDVDAAIFITSAREPMSMTEQDAVLTLIGQPGIRHILFIVTCIDVYPSHRNQERIIDLVRSRLAEDTLEAAHARYGDDPALMGKARRVLAQPDLFAVSSLLAIKGFIHDDEDLLEESRFPEFKNALLDYLTAAQSMDMKAKTIAAAEEVRRGLPGWFADAERELAGTCARLEQERAGQEEYLRTGRAYLIRLLSQMDAALEAKGLHPEKGISVGIVVSARKMFIARLSRLRAGENTHENVLIALRLASREAGDAVSGFCQSMEAWVKEEMKRAEEDFAAFRRKAGFPAGPLEERLDRWREGNAFPAFVWTADPIPNVPDLSAVDVMPQVNAALSASLLSMRERVNEYIASWRAALLQQAAADRQDAAAPQAMQALLEQTQQKLTALRVNYGQHRQQLQEILDKLGMEGNQ